MPDSLTQGHYDGVIHHFREIHLSSWPLDDFKGLKAAVERLHSLCPTKDIQTHLLHLASYGDILPHVDNISASGTWIIGVSLGDERILKMTEVEGEKRDLYVALPSGSVYLQRSVGHIYSLVFLIFINSTGMMSDTITSTVSKDGK